MSISLENPDRVVTKVVAGHKFRRVEGKDTSVWKASYEGGYVTVSNDPLDAVAACLEKVIRDQNWTSYRLWPTSKTS